MAAYCHACRRALLPSHGDLAVEGDHAYHRVCLEGYVRQVGLAAAREMNPTPTEDRQALQIADLLKQLSAANAANAALQVERDRWKRKAEQGDRKAAQDANELATLQRSNKDLHHRCEVYREAIEVAEGSAQTERRRAERAERDLARRARADASQAVAAEAAAVVSESVPDRPRDDPADRFRQIEID